MTLLVDLKDFSTVVQADSGANLRFSGVSRLLSIAAGAIVVSKYDPLPGRFASKARIGEIGMRRFRDDFSNHPGAKRHADF